MTLELLERPSTGKVNIIMTEIEMKETETTDV